MIERLLPPGVACAEAYADPADVRLFPAEAALVAGAVDKRRREFATGRNCARQALRDLGIGPVPIGRGERGAPVWPPGVVGSITHCPGYRAAAVALVSDMRAIGVDAEPNAALPDGVLGVVSLPAERVRLTALTREHAPGTAWDRMLFSAKESVYKAWYPLTGCWLGFEDADITIDPAGGTFSARLLAPGPAPGRLAPAGFTGRWLVSDGLITTVVTVPAADPAAPASQPPASRTSRASRTDAPDSLR